MWLFMTLCCLGTGAASSPTLTGRVLLGVEGLVPATKVQVSMGGVQGKLGGENSCETAPSSSITVCLSFFGWES